VRLTALIHPELAPQLVFAQDWSTTWDPAGKLALAACGLTEIVVAPAFAVGLAAVNDCAATVGVVPGELTDTESPLVTASGKELTLSEL
jgi:hypothetical protein